MASRGGQLVCSHQEHRADEEPYDHTSAMRDVMPGNETPAYVTMGAQMAKAMADDVGYFLKPRSSGCPERTAEGRLLNAGYGGCFFGERGLSFGDAARPENLTA